ncbi:MAG: hypothetical protein Tsb008_07580 [Rhodothalassiaceae bacterium]
MKARSTLIGLPLMLALGCGLVSAVPGSATFGLGIASAAAQSDDKPERKTKKVDSLRAPIYEKIAKAQEKLEKGEKQEAIDDLNKLLTEKINQYEAAIVHQILATSVYFQTEEYGKAIKEFETILTFDRIPDGLVQAALNTLAQLYLIEEKYQKSIDYMKRWMATQDAPGYAAYYFLAQAYYGLEDYKQVIENTNRTITLAREAGVEPKENWYLLLRVAYFELGQMEKVREVLEILTLNFEKPEYWRQLAAIYSELKMEERQFATMEIAYRRGYLENESQLINMAQLYLYHGVPIKAAWVIEKGMKDGTVEKNGKNYELLGQAYLNAQEMRKAEDPLRKAAVALDDGDIWMRLGQVFAELEQWDKAIEPLQKAVDSDDLDKPGYAHLLIGMAHFNLGKLSDAKKAFEKARKFDETKKTAGQWINYTDAEQKRRAQLTEYYGSGGQ